MKKQIVIVLSVITVVLGIAFIATKITNTNTEYAENTIEQTETDTENIAAETIKTEIENTVDLSKINAFIKNPTLANYIKLNSTEKKDRNVIYAAKDLFKPTLIKAFNYTQRMDFEPTSRFNIKYDSLSAYIDSVKQLYCLNKNIQLKLKIKKLKPFRDSYHLKFKDIETDTTLSIHDIYRKLLAYQEILANYHKIVIFKTGKHKDNLHQNEINSIKKYRILLLNYRGVYKKVYPRAIKNPYGLITTQLKRLFILGRDLYKLKLIKVNPTYYDTNGNETKKDIVWGRIDSIIDNSCNN